MEILIVGLIIVALMVYTSTRVKRNAAAAYEAETIDGGEFVIDKPEGFLHNLNADPRYLFEAYSRNFSEDHPKIRVGTARVTTVLNSSVQRVADELASKSRVQEDLSDVDGDSVHLISAIEIDGEAKIEKRYKLASRGETVYKLEVASLDRDHDARWAATFIDSFRVK
jgi:hypothetical protein